MLLAELHGHTVPEVLNNEDYLVSTVFGHLRYLPPEVFWQEFFSCARGETADGRERTLADHLASRTGARISEYSRLRVCFWPRHPTFGVPDLALCFEGEALRPVVVLVEAKLWSDKSGTDDNDQLVRYLRILDDLAALTPEIIRKWSAPPCAAVLYLTPRESLAEIRESRTLWSEVGGDCGRLFRVQWQDIIAVALPLQRSSHGIPRMVLSDISSLLMMRGLQYFDGFARISIPMPMKSGAFYRQCGGFGGFRRLPLPEVKPGSVRICGSGGGFSGFTHRNDLNFFAPRRGAWIQA